MSDPINPDGELSFRIRKGTGVNCAKWRLGQGTHLGASCCSIEDQLGRTFRARIIHV
jgi:hypothetical protein